MTSSLIAAEAVAARLEALLGRSVPVEVVEHGSTTLRQAGRRGLVVAEMTSPAGDRVACACIDLQGARALAAEILAAPPPDEDGPLADAAIDALVEVFAALRSCVAPNAVPEDATVARTSIEAGAQALDPVLALSSGIATLRVRLSESRIVTTAIVLAAPGPMAS